MKHSDENFKFLNDLSAQMMKQLVLYSEKRTGHFSNKDSVNYINPETIGKYPFTNQVLYNNKML